MRTQVTSEQLLAALQSGISPETLEVGSNEPVVTDAPAEPAPAAAPVVAEEPAKPIVEAAPQADDFVTYLKTEVASLKSDMSAKDTTIKELQAEVARLKSSSSPRLLSIIRTACSRQAVALNSQLIGIEKLEGEALADQWEALDKAIAAKFKIGPQSRASADAEAKPTPPVTALGHPKAGKTFRLP